MTDYRELLSKMESPAAKADPVDALKDLKIGADLGDVAVALEAFRARVNGADDLQRRVQRNRAVGKLKEIEIVDAAGLVDAALRATSTPVTTSAPPTSSPDADLEAGRAVLHADYVLDLVAEYVTATGYAGDTRAAKLVYLALGSRLLDRPVNLYLSGPSAGGKNYTIRVALPLLPPEAYYAVAGMSPLAVMYSPESFEHRTVIVSEAAAFHEDGIGASLLRGLAWDSELNYDTVIDGKSVQLHKDGPTGLITTGTRKLEPELATRLWTVPIPDDPKHTRAVLYATAGEAAGQIKSDTTPDAFIAAQRWLAAAGERRVVVPFARELAELVPVHEVRIRRDFTQLLTLIRAHALLHQCRRDRDDQGRVVATVDDYRVVYDVVGPVFEASLSAGLTAEVRETVKAADDLLARPAGTGTVTVTEIATKLKLSPSATWRRIHTALEGRWLVNDEMRKRQPAKIRLGEPLPQTPGLPSPAELAQSCKRTIQPVVGPADERLHERVRGGGDGAQTDTEDESARIARLLDEEAQRLRGGDTGATT